MIRYGYNQQFFPPAPFVHVPLSCQETGLEITDLPAQIDSAADRSAIPATFAEQLKLVALDELPVSGFGGQIMLLQTYRVELTIRNCQRKVVEIFAHAEEPYVLLGRDILNLYRVVLDGPGLFLEIE